METLIRIAVVALSAVAVCQALAVVVIVERALRAVKEAFAFAERANLLAHSQDAGEYVAAEQRLELGRRRALDGPPEKPAKPLSRLFRRPPDGKEPA